jgi:hemoglobin
MRRVRGFAFQACGNRFAVSFSSSSTILSAEGAQRSKSLASPSGAAAGLTEPLIRKVILSFYEKVRRDPLLGPIFEEAIGDEWDPHIERIMLFWLTATGLQRGYDGRNFMPAHLRHSSIHPDQLSRWLELFRQTAAEHCAPECARALIDIAERSLRHIRRCESRAKRCGLPPVRALLDKQLLRRRQLRNCAGPEERRQR